MMRSEEEIRAEKLSMLELSNAEGDPLLKAMYQDRASTLEWVLGD